MERKGAINMYEAVNFVSPPRFTINLAHGVTPFQKTFDGKPYQSAFYRLRSGIEPIVTHAWYRPDRDEFDHLEPAMQDHVLDGGLLFDTLGLAIQKQTPKDLVSKDMPTEGFQTFCQNFYGRSLQPAKGK